jgi:hypothetical protein
VGGFAIAVKQGRNVLPEVIPLVFTPGIVSLKGRHMVTEAIAEELTKGSIGRIEIEGSHGSVGSKAVGYKPMGQTHYN